MLISFVIPCYRSEDTIGNVVAEINKVMIGRDEYEHEIILVNDASPDGTYKVIEKLVEENDNITGVDLAKNSGQQCAIMAGLRMAKGELVAVSDDDGQTPVETVFQLVSKLDEGYDIACANYQERGKRSLIRRFGSWMNDMMVKKFLNEPEDVQTSVYFVARRFVIDEMIRYDSPFPYMPGLLLRASYKIGNVDLVQKDRIAGESGYNFAKLLSLWISGITTFSIKPLRLAIFCGGFLAVAGFITIIVVIIQKLCVADVSLGWTSLIATNLLIGGITLIILGIIGEYVGRIYQGMNKSPQYVVRKVIGRGSEEEQKQPEEGQR